MDFVIVGPEKTATGWIDAALRAHVPEMLPTVTKETFYLDRLYHLGPKWHDGLYAPNASPRGEVSPSYFARPVARQRLYDLNPAARIVVMLRDPYARMASHLLHLMRRGVGDYAADDLGLNAEHWREARESSLYQAHGAAWCEAFGKDAVCFVRHEDIKTDPAGLLQRVAEHIGIDWRPDPVWAAAFSNERVFESRASTSRFTRLAYFISRRLQEAGATEIVEAMRRSPVRKLLERGGADLNAAQARARELVGAQEDFETDIDFAEEVLCADLSDWRASRLSTRPRPGFTPLRQAGDAHVDL